MKNSKNLSLRCTDTRGVAITYIPKGLGDPVQSNVDNNFYFRSGDEFTVAPYSMIKRLFAATEVPDLHPLFRNPLATLGANGVWKIPISLRNDSSAIAEHVHIFVAIDNPSACDTIQIPDFGDVSSINPGKKIFMKDLQGVVHRGFNLVVGTLQVKMKVNKRPKRALKITIALYANKMRAREVEVAIQLAKTGLSTVVLKEHYLY
jgi:hypothetical protein